MKTHAAAAFLGALTFAAAAHGSTVSGGQVFQVCGPQGTPPQIIEQVSDPNSPVFVSAVVNCGNGFEVGAHSFAQLPLTDQATTIAVMGFGIDPATLRVLVPPNQIFGAGAQGFTQQTWGSVALETDSVLLGEPIPLQIELGISAQLEIIDPLSVEVVTTTLLTNIFIGDLGIGENVQVFMNDQGQGSLITSAGGSTLPVQFNPSSGRSFLDFTTTLVLTESAPFGEEFDVNAGFGGQGRIQGLGSGTPDSLTVFFRLSGDHTFTYSIESLDPRVVFQAIPEPSTGLLVAAGLAALMLSLRRRS